MKVESKLLFVTVLIFIITLFLGNIIPYLKPVKIINLGTPSSSSIVEEEQTLFAVGAK